MKDNRLKFYSSEAEAERAKARRAARRTYTERFYLLMELIKVSAMISSAKKIKNSNN
jgi:hypothetical protein